MAPLCDMGTQGRPRPSDPAGKHLDWIARSPAGPRHAPACPNEGTPDSMTDQALTPRQNAPTRSDETAERPLWPAIRRGLRRRCPACGAGPMMQGYLKVRESCPVCGEALHHQRADDGPAYLTILVVGHLMAPLLMWSFIAFRPDPLILASTFVVGTVALSLYLLPRLKGMMVAIQWSRRMHGFGKPA